LHSFTWEQRVLQCIAGAIRSGVGDGESPDACTLDNFSDFRGDFTARAGVTYTITSYPGGLADLPCDAFEKNADGSWTQVAILVAGGALIPAGNRFKDSAETRIIEKKCNKQ